MIYSKRKRIASLTQPSLEKLLEKVPSKYELVLLAARRARQIKREVDFRPERQREFEFTKPLTTALFEIVDGKITAEDLKYVDLFEEPDEGRETPRIPVEIASKKFFGEEEAAVEAADLEPHELSLDDIEEPEDDELGEVGEE